MSDRGRTPMDDEGRMSDSGSGSWLAVAEARPSPFEEVLRAAPGLARIALGAGLRGAAWAAGSYANTASRVLRAAAGGESGTQVLQETGSELRDYARQLLGLGDPGVAQRGESRPPAQRPSRASEEASPEALRSRGAELLQQAADVRREEASHPAYMLILESLAPDEARILRFLARNGPQPSVDVRAGLPLASELVAPGRNMLGAEAGCHHADRVHAYLDNLHRLGLARFSRERVKDVARYQVLEAQPEVAEARARAGRITRTVRRSILLTPFGEDFCAVCLPLTDLEPLD